MGTGRLAAISLAILAAFAPGSAGACAYDGVLGSGLGAAHPGSIAVALAVRRTIELGELPAFVAVPSAAGNAGYWEAVGRLAAFRRSLPPAEDMPSVSILLVESNLWARLTPVPGGYAMTPHTAAARPGDVVVLTTEPVLAALAGKRLKMAGALSRDLVVVDGDAARAWAVRRVLAGFSPDRETGGWVRPARLFGPGG